MTKKIKLIARGSKPQVEFINSKEKAPCFVAGFGSGKTQALIYRALKLKIQYKDAPIAYYLPSYDLIAKIGYPRFVAEIEKLGLSYNLNKSEKMIYIEGYSFILFRSLDSPERIVGYEVAHSFVDELDTLKTEKARICWNQILARNRYKIDGINSCSVGTTPEGFRFVYEKWKKNPKNGYELIKASTYSNLRNLPHDYIDTLKESYPDSLIDAYIEGEFVNLTSGTIYNFDRKRNECKIEDDEKFPLHIGMDFNVEKMSAVVHIFKDNIAYAVNEFSNIFDTPEMIQKIKEVYPKRNINIYPDASGQNRKSSNASETDISLLKQNFRVVVNKKNPYVRDRILSMNSAFLNGKGETRYFVNTNNCPNYTDSLEHQVYNKNGEPDKENNFDHLPDAGGYFITYAFPVQIRRKSTQKGF